MTYESHGLASVDRNSGLLLPYMSQHSEFSVKHYVKAVYFRRERYIYVTKANTTTVHHGKLLPSPKHDELYLIRVTFKPVRCHPVVDIPDAQYDT